MTELKAEQIVKILGLKPLPIEGGMYAETWMNEFSSAIYYFLKPPEISGLHRLPSVEIFHYYGGAPAQMLLLFADGHIEEPVLGMDLDLGQRPQIAVLPGTWQATESLGQWTLLGTHMAPPYQETTVEFGKAAYLIPKYPSAAGRISRLSRG